MCNHWAALQCQRYWHSGTIKPPEIFLLTLRAKFPWWNSSAETFSKGPACVLSGPGGSVAASARISSGRRLPAVSSFRCDPSSSPAPSLPRPCRFSAHLFFHCLCLFSSLFQRFSSEGISRRCLLCSLQNDGDWRRSRARARLFLERFSLLWLDNFSSSSLKRHESCWWFKSLHARTHPLSCRGSDWALSFPGFDAAALLSHPNNERMNNRAPCIVSVSPGFPVSGARGGRRSTWQPITPQD